jgi:hypothetical protein
MSEKMFVAWTLAIVATAWGSVMIVIGFVMGLPDLIRATLRRTTDRRRA